MLRSLLIPVLCGLALSSAHAQLVTQGEIEARLTGKVVMLRGMYSDDKLKFDAAGHPAHHYRTDSPMVSGFELSRVQVSGHHLRLEGERVWLVADGKSGLRPVHANTGTIGLPHPEKLTIEVDNGASADFAPAIDAIFADGLADMMDQLPEEWQRYLRWRGVRSRGTAASGGPADNDAAPAGGGPAPAPGLFRVGGSVRAPRVLHYAEAEFSETARRVKFSGNVIVTLVVDVEGNPTCIWVRQPVGLGLDEKAVAAVRQYRFAPATRNGEPVPVELSVEVNFQVF